MFKAGASPSGVFSRKFSPDFNPLSLGERLYKFPSLPPFMVISWISLADKQKDAMRHAISDDFTYLATGSVRSGKTYASMFGFFVYSQALREKRTHVVASRNLRVLEMELIPALQDFAESFNVAYNYTKFDASSHDRATNNTICVPDMMRLLIPVYRALQCIVCLRMKSRYIPEVFWKTLLSTLYL